jgi:hypothetical protein
MAALKFSPVDRCPLQNLACCTEVSGLMGTLVRESTSLLSRRPLALWYLQWCDPASAASPECSMEVISQSADAFVLLATIAATRYLNGDGTEMPRFCTRSVS